MSHYSQVVRYANLVSFPAIGDTSKLYVDDNTFLIYFWDGSAYQVATAPQIIDGVVNTYADLPTASSHNGEIWFVTTTTGIKYINQKVAGFYASNGTTWTLITPVDIDGYQKLITSPTANDILTTDINGQSQDSGKSFSTDGTLASNSDVLIPTEKAVKTYSDTKISKTIANEINQLTTKSTLVANDKILGEDSANSWSKIGISLTAIFNFVKNTFSARKMYYVSSSGSDSNNGLTPETAFLTLAQALSVSDNSGNQIVVLPGTYAENTTITDLNCTITSPNNETGGICNFTGILTVSNASSSVRLNGLTIATLNKTGGGSLNLDKTSIGAGGFSDSGSGYVRATQCDFTAGLLSITGAGFKNFESSCAIGRANINNAAAVVTMKDSQKIQTADLSNTLTLTNGILVTKNTTVFAVSSSYFAINALAGSLIRENIETVNATDGTPTGKVNIASGVLFSNRNVIDSDLSTISGTNLGYKSSFDNLKILGQVASRILATDSNKNIISLDTSTFPNLTELSYLKGVTRSITVFIPDSGSGGQVGLVPAPTAGQGNVLGGSVCPSSLRANGVFASDPYVSLACTLASNIVLTATGAWGKVQFDTKEIDTNNIYNTNPSYAEATIPYAGRYKINLSVTISDATKQLAIGIAIDGNSDPIESTKCWYPRGGVSDYETKYIEATVDLAANSVVRAAVYNFTSGTTIITAGTRFEIELLRAK